MLQPQYLEKTFMKYLLSSSDLLWFIVENAELVFLFKLNVSGDEDDSLTLICRYNVEKTVVNNRPFNFI